MQNISIHTIEDCLEVLTGLRKHNLKFNINSSDATIINSIARQVFKGTALTDRQYALMTSKLLDYKDQFENNSITGFDMALTKLRKDLRVIDRSKYIKVVTNEEIPFPTDKKIRYIKIKFPFSKNMIGKITNCVSKCLIKNYYHEKGSHEHYFVFNELCTKTIVEEFQNSMFEIDNEILAFYKQIKEIADNVHLNLPVILDNTIFVNDNMKKKIEQETNLDIVKIVDRHRRYGLINLQSNINSDCLYENIAFRNDVDFFCDPNKITVKEIVEALNILNRFPLLVVIESGNEEEQLYSIYNAVKDIIPNEKQSVLFRLDGEHDFNFFVKNNNLNNWVDKSTKIVYIQNDKLPKILLKSEWSPVTAIVFDLSSSSYKRHVQYYIRDCCDLVILRSDNEYYKKIYKQYYDNV